MNKKILSLVAFFLLICPLNKVKANVINPPENAVYSLKSLSPYSYEYYGSTMVDYSYEESEIPSIKKGYTISISDYLVSMPIITGNAVEFRSDYSEIQLELVNSYSQTESISTIFEKEFTIRNGATFSLNLGIELIKAGVDISVEQETKIRTVSSFERDESYSCQTHETIKITNGDYGKFYRLELRKYFRLVYITYFDEAIDTKTGETYYYVPIEHRLDLYPVGNSFLDVVKYDINGNVVGKGTMIPNSIFYSDFKLY